jgi:hypothetical protein
MYTLVRRYLKTAILFLAAGLCIGAWMIVRRELWGEYPNPSIVSAHTHALFVGFVMMTILGVALWLFPRPDKSDTRYRPWRIELAYWLLTGGTATRVEGELLRPMVAAMWLKIAVILSGFAQIAAIALFFFTMWTRIRPVGSQGREARGERF